MALIYKDEDVALGLKSSRQIPPNLSQVLFDIVVVRLSPRSKLVNERAQEPPVFAVQLADEISRARRSIDVFLDTLEYSLDLLIQFRAVGQYQNPRIGDVFPNPLREPDHRETLTASLRVPDDTAIVALREFLRCLDAKILVVPGKSF